MATSKARQHTNSHFSNLMEWKRYGHWKSSAEKTRFSAFVLWELRTNLSLIEELKAKCPNGTGHSSLNLTEAFRRESALALELVIKAVIARKIEEGSLTPDKLQFSHNIPVLWKNAELGQLSKKDSQVLLWAKQILNWRGRYATPKNAETWKQETHDFDRLSSRRADSGSKFEIQEAKDLDWTDFDRLYQIAYKVLVNLP